MLILAHRGASKAAPENTVEAFNLAVAQGASGIEFDTYQHECGIVVFHDRRLERTTNGTGLLLNTPNGILNTLDAGNGNGIPTLEDTLATLSPEHWCNIEIKHLRDVKQWVNEVKQALQYSAVDLKNVIVSSFNHHWLHSICALWPEVNIGALTASYSLDVCADARRLNAYSMHIAIDTVSYEYVKQVKQRGFKVLVYTVDEPDDIQRLYEWGVDGIFTNTPDVAKHVVSKL